MASGAAFLKLKATVLLTILIGALGMPAFASGKAWMQTMAEARRKDISYDMRLEHCLSALNEAKKFGVDDPRYSESLRMLSQTHFQLLQYEEGEKYVQEECALLEKMGDNYPSLDYDYFWLGIMAETRGELEKANRLMNKALVLCTEFLKPGLPTPPEIYSHLCAQAFAQGHAEEAKRYADLAAKFLLARNKETESVEKIMLEEIGSLGTFLEQVHSFIYLRKQKLKPITPGAERMMRGYRAANRQVYISLINECEKTERPESELYMRSLQCLTRQLVLSGDAVLAKSYLEPGIKTAEQYYQGDYNLLSGLYYDLGCALKTLGNPGAEEAFKQSIRYKALGHLGVIAPLVALSTLLQNRGQFEAAIEVVNSSSGGPEDDKIIHTQLADLYQKFGTAQFIAGKREESLKAFKRSLEELEKAKLRSRYLFGAWQLGHGYLLLGHTAEAERYLKIVVQSHIAGKSFEDDDLLFRAKQELAAVYSKTGRESEAKVLSNELKDISYLEKERRALQSKIEAAPENSIERRNLLTTLALAEKRVGDTLLMGFRPKEAFPIQQSAAKHFTEALCIGLDYYGVQCSLAEAEMSAGHFDSAEKVLLTALMEMRFYAAPGYPQLKARAINDLKRLYEQTGAHPPILQALTPQYQAQTNPLTASVYQKDWEYRPEKAIHQLEQLVAIDRKVFGDKSVFVKSSLDYLAHGYFMAGDYVRAQKAYKEWLNINSPGLYGGIYEIANYLLLAEVYNKTGQYRESEAICRKMMERGKALTGQARVRCMQILGASCILQGRLEEGRQLFTVARRLCPEKCALLSISRVMVRILESLRPSRAAEEIKICEDELAAYYKAPSQNENECAFLVHELGLAFASVGNTDKACQLLKQSLDNFKPTTSSELELRLNWIIEYQRTLRARNRIKEADSLNEQIRQIKAITGGGTTARASKQDSKK